MKKLFLVKWPDNSVTVYYGDTRTMVADLDAIDDPSCAVCKEITTMCLEMDATTKMEDGNIVAVFSNPRDCYSLDTTLDNAYTDQGEQEWKAVMDI